MRYDGQKKLDEAEMVVSIDINDEEFGYMRGHVVDGKNILPATGYLSLIWQMIGRINGQYWADMPIVFENVAFMQATILSPENPSTLILSMLKGNIAKNNFANRTESYGK